MPLRLWVVTIYGGLSENGLCFMCFVCVCVVLMGWDGVLWAIVGVTCKYTILPWPCWSNYTIDLTRFRFVWVFEMPGG